MLISRLQQTLFGELVVPGQVIGLPVGQLDGEYRGQRRNKWCYETNDCKPVRCDVPGCAAAFLNKAALELHRAAVHAEQPAKKNITDLWRRNAGAWAAWVREAEAAIDQLFTERQQAELRVREALIEINKFRQENDAEAWDYDLRLQSFWRAHARRQAVVSEIEGRENLARREFERRRSGPWAPDELAEFNEPSEPAREAEPRKAKAALGREHIVPVGAECIS